MEQNGDGDLHNWLEDRLPPERAVIARLWGLPAELHTAARAMATAILRPDRVRAVVAKLQPREREALQRLQAHGGTLPAPVVEREFGVVREAENYANPRAYLLALSAPPSPTERLYLLGLAQLQQHGASRSYMIPADLLALLPPVPGASARIAIAPAAAPPKEFAGNAHSFERYLLALLTLAHEGAIDLIPSGGMTKASLLRLVRMWDAKAALNGVSREEHLVYFQFLRQVGEGTNLLRAGSDAKLHPTREAIEWMRLPTFDRARRLLDGWAESRFDELASFAGMKFARAYGRDVTRAKRALLRLVAQVPAGEWIAFDEFIVAVKTVEPDYARPHGLYDTWGIQSFSRVPLDGYVHWERVEGEQIRGIVGGSLHWLGLTDVGMDGKTPTSFRLSAVGAALLQDTAPPTTPPTERLVVQANFEVLVPPYTSLYDQFQLARMAERITQNDVAVFKLTRRALQAAIERDAAFEDIERFLAEASGRPLPQNVAATLREWAKQHGRVGIRRVVLLETDDAALMQQLRHDKRLRFPEAEQLTDTAWLVREGDAPQLAERLRKAGYGLASDNHDMQPNVPLSEHDLTVMIAALEFYATASGMLEIEGEASVALRRRATKLLPEKALNRAFQTSRAAAQALRNRLRREEEIT